MKITFLGDTHGDWNAVHETIARNKGRKVFHAGDIGVGFAQEYSYYNHRLGLWEVKKGFKDPEYLGADFEFIRGNHDNPEECRKHPNYMGDYGYREELNMFFMSGAWSIDKDWRKPNIDWWEEEELSYSEMNKAIELYDKTRPSVVLSHTPPTPICNLLCNGTAHGSRTEKALANMWEIHKPKMWIFGHWHMLWRKVVLDTDFVCLPINGKFRLDLPLT